MGGEQRPQPARRHVPAPPIDPAHHVCTQPFLTDNDRLNISRLGIHETIPASVINRPYGNVDFLFMFFHTPSVFAVDRQLRALPANTMVIWEPGQSHHYGNPERDWEHSWIHFGGTEAERLIRGRDIPLNRPFRLRDAYLIDKHQQAIFAEIIGHAQPDIVIIGNLLEIWMRELERDLHPQQNPAVPRVFLEVKGYLEANFRQPQRLADLADRTCLSVPHFCAQFKRFFGMSAIDYLVRLRMQHAAFLLKDFSMNVKQVAEKVGYSDLYYFSKLFKKHHEASPRNFRGRIRKEAGLVERG